VRATRWSKKNTRATRTTLGGLEMEKMRATVFHGVNDIRVEEVERPGAGVGEAVIRVTPTTVCGTNLHIVRGENPVA